MSGLFCEIHIITVYKVLFPKYRLEAALQLPGYNRDSVFL